MCDHLELDPKRLGALKTRRGYRLWVVQVPCLRLAGLLLMVLAIFLHNRYLLGQDSVPEAVGFGLGALAWSAASWALTAHFYAQNHAIGELFVILDLIPFTVCLALTGGPHSWLYPMLIIRPADQIGAGARRVALIGALSVACYGLLIAACPHVGCLHAGQPGDPCPLSESLGRLALIA